MPSPPLPLFERVSNSFTQLSTVAADLNAVSDELGKSVSQIDEALKKLNLGITVWVQINRWSYPGSNRSTTEYLGYAKVNGKWGIGLRIQNDEDEYFDEAGEELWLFSDAPRALRVSAIDKLPELLENLSKEAVKAAAQVKAKLENVKDVAAAMNSKLATSHVAKAKDEVFRDDVTRAMLTAAKGTIIADVLQTARKLQGETK